MYITSEVLFPNRTEKVPYKWRKIPYNLQLNEAELGQRWNATVGQTGVPRSTPAMLPTCENGRLLASHQGEPGSIPGGVAPWIFACVNRAGRCRWSAGFLCDLPFPPPLHSGIASFSHRFTLIASPDLDITSRPNLLTHSEPLVYAMPRAPYNVVCGHGDTKNVAYLERHTPWQLESLGALAWVPGTTQSAAVDICDGPAVY
ncbi:hypothetical protein PR048_008694 [Dryococelus australis]|uniref:Uncharacterized protein n=1 Tax=Dryococelus australis TaxID=614101 RepID=A0ABQ9HXU5_9NEOP|nr:hypothetical protein PR048_008694 [Dryococelus australis]